MPPPGAAMPPWPIGVDTTSCGCQVLPPSVVRSRNPEGIRTSPKELTTRKPLFASENATPGQKAEARSKAQSLLRKVRGGADFATVARAESQDPGTAQNGGDLGFFAKGRMTPAFEAAAFKLKAGEISGVVETPFGFHIIRVHERRAPRTATLAEVSGQIKQFLEQGRRDQKLETFIQQVRGKSKIDILV